MLSSYCLYAYSYPRNLLSLQSTFPYHIPCSTGEKSAGKVDVYSAINIQACYISVYFLAGSSKVVQKPNIAEMKDSVASHLMLGVYVGQEHVFSAWIVLDSINISQEDHEIDFVAYALQYQSKVLGSGYQKENCDALFSGLQPNYALDGQA